MSSRDMRPTPRRRSAVALAAGFLVLALAGCSARPLYAPGPGGGSLSATLSTIEIAEVDTRVAQEVRNKLIYDLGIRNAAGPARYTMGLTVSSTETPLGVTPVESAPASNVTVAVTYTVRDPATDKIVFRDTRRASASYDLVNQAFANERAHRDAENRAAVRVAEAIRIQLSAAATRGVF